MAFLEIKFPESISFNSSSMVEFNTNVIQTKNGSEQRNINWTFNRMKFNVINGIKTKNELDELLSFFRVVKGRAYGFRFKDWSDYSVTNQKVAISDGIENNFQLIKTYNINDNYYIRKITKPIISTISLYVNDLKTTDFNIDLSTGVITFNNIPNIDSIITADFEFDVPVRFDNDILEITLDTINSGSIKNLTLIETNEF